MSLLYNLNTQQLLDVGRVPFALLTVAFFTFIYFSFSTIVFFMFTKGRRFSLYQTKPIRPGQIRWEVRRSVVSILMFGILSFPLYEGLQTGFFRFDFDFTWSRFLLEAMGLFLWNEVYFYIVHRLFHLRQLYPWHLSHHDSAVPTPFSAYSFHWSEGLALGAVMPIAMCFYDFQFWALMTLPLMSLLMNVLGHSNVDFFSKPSMNSLLNFSRRHSQHHKNPSTNFGFFLPFFDRFLGTDHHD